jgi:hypothetical protein
MDLISGICISFQKNLSNKLGQIKKPGIMSCIHIRSNFGDDPAISPGVIAIFVFSVLPPGGKAKNQDTGPRFCLQLTLT